MLRALHAAAGHAGVEARGQLARVPGVHKLPEERARVVGLEFVEEAPVRLPEPRRELWVLRLCGRCVSRHRANLARDCLQSSTGAHKIVVLRERVYAGARSQRRVVRLCLLHARRAASSKLCLPATQRLVWRNAERHSTKEQLSGRTVLQELLGLLQQPLLLLPLLLLPLLLFVFLFMAFLRRLVCAGRACVSLVARAGPTALVNRPVRAPLLAEASSSLPCLRFLCLPIRWANALAVDMQSLQQALPQKAVSATDGAPCLRS